jgi:predicted phosphoadenosine phosphosulfate sulfurtransferase
MEFEEFVPKFGHEYSGGDLCACFVGIRSDESLNRYRTIAGHGTKFEGRKYTNYQSKTLYNVYPIYDWNTKDIWTYASKTKLKYNALYDRMHQAGLTIHQMRICQPYGDDQRKGLWLYHIIEPETWGRVVARVSGANGGALYCQESGNIQGRTTVTLPPGHTWQSFTMLLLSTLPEKSKLHFENKVAQFLAWYRDRGYPNGIPDFADLKDEASKKVPSWRRVAKSVLRNDYWCKGLSFTQTKSEAYGKYLKIMKKRRSKWNLI